MRRGSRSSLSTLEVSTSANLSGCLFCQLLAATLFAHGFAMLGVHESDGLGEHGGPLMVWIHTIIPDCSRRRPRSHRPDLLR